MESIFRDLRLAARGLRRNPGFTTVAVVTLALGIGATTAVFSVVYGVLLRPLPFPNADRLVQIAQTLEPDTPDGERHRASPSPDQVANLQEDDPGDRLRERHQPAARSHRGTRARAGRRAPNAASARSRHRAAKRVIAGPGAERREPRAG